MLRYYKIILTIIAFTIIILVIIVYGKNLLGMGPYTGPRPANIPDHAVHSGNANIGHWVACERRLGDLYFCRIYYRSGEVLVESDFRLKRKVSNGNHDRQEPREYFFNLTYIKTDLGPLIPVSEYLRYTPKGRVHTLAFYAEENCRREIAAVGERDAVETLRAFFRRFRAHESPNITVKNRQIISYERKIVKGEVNPEAFVCRGARIKKFVINGQVPGQEDKSFTAYLRFCSNCDYEIAIQD